MSVRLDPARARFADTGLASPWHRFMHGHVWTLPLCDRGGVLEAALRQLAGALGHGGDPWLRIVDTCLDALFDDAPDLSTRALDELTDAHAASLDDSSREHALAVLARVAGGMPHGTESGASLASLVARLRTELRSLPAIGGRHVYERAHIWSVLCCTTRSVEVADARACERVILSALREVTQLPDAFLAIRGGVTLISAIARSAWLGSRAHGLARTHLRELWLRLVREQHALRFRPFDGLHTEGEHETFARALLLLASADLSDVEAAYLAEDGPSALERRFWMLSRRARASQGYFCITALGAIGYLDAPEVKELIERVAHSYLEREAPAAADDYLRTTYLAALCSAHGGYDRIARACAARLTARLSQLSAAASYSNLYVTPAAVAGYCIGGLLECAAVRELHESICAFTPALVGCVDTTKDPRGARIVGHVLIDAAVRLRAARYARAPREVARTIHALRQERLLQERMDG